MIYINRSLAYAGLISFMLLLCIQSLESQDIPYAPVYAIPSDLEANQYAHDQRERLKSRIPSKSEVEVPPYPDAVVFMVATSEEVKQIVGADGFAEIKILTSDPMDQIIRFYKEHLPDWNYHEEYSIFWFGDGEFSVMRIMEGMPNVSIQEASPVTQQFLSDASYIISIVYRTNP